MTDKNLVFFDCECANTKGGIGKICSLGYVICDENFNLIKKEDIVMNPECEFDWFLFSGKGDIALAYSREYFRSQPAFPQFYDKIKQIFTENSPFVAGFAVSNDVHFVNSACNRYALPFINFAAFDVRNLLEQHYGQTKKLKDWFAFFEEDQKNTMKFQFHNSADDAHATMLCLEGFCRKTGKTAFQIFDERKDLFTSSQFSLKQMQEREEKKALMSKIERLYNRQNKNSPYTSVLSEHFEFDKSMFRLGERTVKLARKIYDNGGLIHKHLHAGSGTVIFSDEEEMKKNNGMLKKRNLEGITFEKIMASLD